MLARLSMASTVYDKYFVSNNQMKDRVRKVGGSTPGRVKSKT